jgi:hypothetical protein
MRAGFLIGSEARHVVAAAAPCLECQSVRRGALPETAKSAVAAAAPLRLQSCIYGLSYRLLIRKELCQLTFFAPLPGSWACLVTRTIGAGEQLLLPGYLPT